MPENMPQPIMPRGEPDQVNISDLLLDYQNPRFGDLDPGTSQEALVDLIVDRFGVDDVISSIAVNGFFSAEPLVCQANDSPSLVVKEGNRRLCASIIITGDPRGKNQANLHRRFNKIWKDNGQKAIEPISVLKFYEKEDADSDLLAYLGVRHISASQPWDSYAKASWVAKLQDSSELSETKISEMIGDNHSTVVRLLEGYRFIQQLISEEKFVPSDSQRKGRGSVTEYPFSWVYTLLGFRSARDFCGLDETSGKPNPIPADYLENASNLIKACFGDKSKGRSAAIDDSRQLIQLAQSMTRSDVAALINDGHSLKSALDSTKPVEQRLSENLQRARELLANISTGLEETPPLAEVAGQHIETAAIVRRLSTEIHKKLNAISFGDDDE